MMLKFDPHHDIENAAPNSSDVELKRDYHMMTEAFKWCTLPLQNLFAWLPAQLPL